MTSKPHKKCLPGISTPHRCRGLTLIEVMISLTIGLILLAGLVTLLTNTSSTRTEIDKSSRQIENGRYATSLIADDIRHAGYYGAYYSLPAVPAALPDPCATGATAASLLVLQNGVSLPLQGYNNPAATPLTCLAASEYVATTDILVIRRANTAPTLPANMIVKRAYIQSNSKSDPIINLGQASLAANTTTFTLTDKNVKSISDDPHDTMIDPRAYEVHIYFISPCSGTSCAANNDGIPTLKRLQLTSDASGSIMTTEPLVEGIENMQLEYGIDTIPTAVNANTGFIGDGSADSYTAAPADATAWSNVTAVGVYLLARNTESSPGFTDSKKYCLKATCPTAADLTTPTATNFKRHVFNALVRVINPSSRRSP